MKGRLAARAIFIGLGMALTLLIRVPDVAAASARLTLEHAAVEAATSAGQGESVPALERQEDAVESLRRTVRRDSPSVVIGVLVIGVGLGALLLFLAQHEVRDTALVFFGVFSLLYGCRLILGTYSAALLLGFDEPATRHVDATITYWINVPVMLFMERVLDRAWRPVVRFLRYAWIGFAIIATPLEWLAGANALLMPINNVTVIAGFALLLLVFVRMEREPDRRISVALGTGIGTFALLALNNNLSSLGALPWGEGPEELGFLVFIACLGYVVAIRQLASERHLLSIEQELRTARQIQRSILPRELPTLRGLDVDARYVPMTAVGGDFYDFLLVDDRRIGILVADVSGHGVPAALIASMVKVAIAAQQEHADQPARVLAQMNQILCGKLERQFVTAAYAYLDLDAGRLVTAGAGHPPALLWNDRERRVMDVASTGIMLGQFPDAGYETTSHDIGPGDCLLLYTDGVIETTDDAGDFFDPDRLRAFLEARHDAGAELGANLLDHLASWSGRDLYTGGFEDDLTVVTVSVGAGLGV